jgi:hypothetical protein
MSGNVRKIVEFPDRSASGSPVPSVGERGAKRFALCAVCRTPLPVPQATGRPRLTCSVACRRRRERAVRKIERRMEWIWAWQAVAAEGAYSRAHVRREIRGLRAELPALYAAAGLERRDTDD